MISIKRTIAPFVLMFILPFAGCSENAVSQLDKVNTPVLIFSAPPVSTEDNSASTERSFKPDEEFNDTNVPDELLLPYLVPAKEAIFKRLGVTVHEDAGIVFSEFDEELDMLNISWLYNGGAENEDVYQNLDKNRNYYSAGFNNVDLDKGTGTVVYVRTQGNTANERTETLSAQALKEFETQRGEPVPETLMLVTDMWEWDGTERSVLFTWQQTADINMPYPTHTAGYDNVNADFTDGDLSFLEIEKVF
jgi:hypothetical protein